jgi:hypothetical protein
MEAYFPQKLLCIIDMIFLTYQHAKVTLLSCLICEISNNWLIN